MSPILFFIPAVLMIIAIVGIPQDWPTRLVRSHWRFLAVSFLYVLGILGLILWYPLQRGFTGLQIYIFVLPHFSVGLAAFLMQASLRATRIAWLLIVGSLALLILVCLALAGFAALGNLSPVWAFLDAIASSGVAIVAAVWMGWSLRRWRKVSCLLMGIFFPVVLFVSVQLGWENSPESITRRNGESIVHSVKQYRAENGTYPPSLTALVPSYLTELKDPGTMWGWLYTSTADDFTLGYVSYVDRFGYGICKYTAKTPAWNCPLDYSAAPFLLPPTPMP